MPRESKFDIRGAYFRAMREKGGALPTVREIALRVGAPVDLVRYHLRHMDLPYTRMTASECGRLSSGEAKRRTEERMRAHHAAFVARHGRMPTRREINLAMGMAPDSHHADVIAKRLGLELARSRRTRTPDEGGDQKKGRESVKTPPDREFRFGSEISPRMEKILAIQNGTDAGEGDGRAHMPGEGYAPEARIMLTCPVCGMRALIAPRMHPYWIRNRAGSVIFVCRDACTGRVTGG